MTLTSLPNELIEHIASYLDLSSIRSLRLTTSSLTRATSHLFRERFFHRHKVTWTKQSLDTLVQISQHPHYGTALRHLVIDATPQHSMHFWRLRKQVSETAAISTPYGAVKSPSQFALETQYTEAEKKMNETTTFFNETRYDQKMLKLAFENFSMKPGGSSLTSLTFWYTGLAASYAKGSPLYCHLSQWEMSRPFVSTLAALASSPNIHIHSISLARSAPHGAVSIGRLESLAPSLSSFDTAFATLHHLALNLRDWRSPDKGFQLSPTARAPFIVRFLAKAQYLRELELSCHSTLEPNLFAEIARHCVFPHLQSVKLSVLSVTSAQDLTAFLAPAMKSQLTSLRLRHVLLLDRETEWDEWLAWMASTMDEETEHDEGKRSTPTYNITHFCVADLFRPRGEIVYFQGNRALCLGEDWAWRLKRILEDEGIEAREYRPHWNLGAFAYPFVGLSM